MKGHEYPSDDDAGTPARARRDEVHDLIEFGVPVEALQSHSAIDQSYERQVGTLLEAGDREGAVSLIEGAYESLGGDGSNLDEEIL